MFGVAHWILEIIIRFLVSEGKIISSILMTSVMYLQLSMQEKYIIEHTNTTCHLCTLSSTCRSLCNISTHLTKTIEHTHVKALVSAPEHQVS